MSNDQTPQGTDEKELDKSIAGGTPADTGTDQGNPNPPIDYKAKFSASSAEAQRLLEENKRIAADLEAERVKHTNQLTSVDPMEAELKAQFPEWDTFTDITKKVIKQQHQDSKLIAELAADKKWNAEISSLVAEDKYKGLNVDKEFERFALKPEHRNLSLKTLANAYLFEKAPQAPEAPVPPVRDEGLPRGSAGPRGEQNTRKKYKASELKTLRETDYKTWQKITATIDFDDITED